MSEAVTADRLLRHLRDEVFCRLAPSRVHGVGVFAIRAIPSGMKLFPVRCDLSLPVESSAIASLPKSSRKLFVDMAEKEGDTYWTCARDFHALEMGHYVNHSVAPNVALECIGEHEYLVAVMDISEGQELLRNYGEEVSK